MTATCESCKWWADGYRENGGTWIDADGWGDCRRRAPTHNPSCDYTDFPRSHRNDWCGEHQPKEPTP